VGPQFNPVMEQFQNEIDVLMRLQQTARHPNIIHLEDVYITNSVIYMIMEYMRGGEVVLC
jgi:serine/threonine protein kinase